MYPAARSVSAFCFAAALDIGYVSGYIVSLMLACAIGATFALGVVLPDVSTNSHCLLRCICLRTLRGYVTIRATWASPANHHRHLWWTPRLVRSTLPCYALQCAASCDVRRTRHPHHTGHHDQHTCRHHKRDELYIGICRLPNVWFALHRLALHCVALFLMAAYTVLQESGLHA